jgi:hypothetical protein
VLGSLQYHYLDFRNSGAMKLNHSRSTQSEIDYPATNEGAAIIDPDYNRFSSLQIDDTNFCAKG